MSHRSPGTAPGTTVPIEVFDAAPTGVAMTLGPQHVFTWANDAFERLTARSRRELVGRRARDAFPELLAQGVLDIATETLRAGRASVLPELHVRVRRGGEMADGVFHVTVHPLLSGRRTYGLLIQAVELTEQLRIIHERDALARERATILDELPVGVAAVNLDGTSRFSNDRARAILGRLTGDNLDGGVAVYAPRRMDGTPYARADVPLARALRGEEVRAERMLIRSAGDGTDRYVDVEATPLRDGTGAITGAVSTFADVSEAVLLSERAARGEALTQAICEAAGSGIVVRDSDGTIVHVNQSARRLLGVGDSVIGMRLLHGLRRYRPDGTVLPETELPASVALRERRDVRDELMRFVRPDGAEYWVVIDAVPVFDEAGAPAQVVTSFTDVTARQQASEELRLYAERLRVAEEQFRLLTERSSDLTLRLGADDAKILYASPSAMRILGYAPAELVGSHLSDHVHAEDAGRLLAAQTGLVNGDDEVAFEARVSRRVGGYAVLNAVARGLRAADGTLQEIHAWARDVTEQRRAEGALERSALYDPLTGLPNRALLLDRLQQTVAGAARGGHSVGLLLVDVVRFREVNETLGDAGGDGVLRAIAERLRTTINHGTTVARVGGDKFGLIVPLEDGVAQLRAVAAEVGTLFESPFDVEGRVMYLDAAIGGAIGPRHGADADTLFRHAGACMYEAARTETPFVLWTEERVENSPRALRLAADLRSAASDGQLRLHYQPIVDLRTRRIVGVEALVRWAHPELGLVPPGEFIGIAERNGQIRNIGLWVLEQSVAQAMAWRRGGRRFEMGVNLSIRNLRSDDLPTVVAATLRRHDAPRGTLRIELTESVAVDPADRTLDTLARLRQLGVEVSIDDFGTGYSSLVQLQRVPASHLKIDRSFVIGLRTDQHSEAIVGSTITLAHSLGLKAVAEGVEDEHTLERLAVLGADLAQGYHIGRPMPPDELERWLASSPYATGG